ncbi:MAG TPA: KTSC domain-containing protein, partial [Acidimicrobiia bacterium]|nr:KTSC domain-containing protein [Acidimicrobiia bacterium]
MAKARTDSETAQKAQALREAAELGCAGAHRHPDGTWMACSTMAEYERVTGAEKEKSALDLIEETQKIRERKGSKRKRKNRQWEKLREQGVSGIDTLPGGGLVSGKGLTFRPVDGDIDVFDDINKARRRARQLGCIGVSRRTSRSGRRVWTPCSNMTDYARRTGSTALGRRYQDRLQRQQLRQIVREELSRMKRRKKRLVDELYEFKALGGGIGRRGARAARFDPNAWDGDNDGIVQEGTPYERPAIPGVNTNLPGQRLTRQKPREYPKDQRDAAPERGMRSRRMDPKSSSAINQLDYDDDTEELAVTFASGQTYIYGGVTSEMVDDIESAPSIGRAINELKANATYVKKPDGTVDGTLPPAVGEAVADPDFPHPAFARPSHGEHTEMVPIEFFDEMPGNLDGYDDQDRSVAAPSGVFRSFEKDAPIIRKMTDDLTDDIRANGIKEALMVNYNPQTGDVNLEEGNHRLIAARRLGMTHVPVRMNRTTVERENISGPRKQIGGMKKHHERYEHMDLDGEYLGAAFKPSQVGVPTRPKDGGGMRSRSNPSREEKIGDLRNLWNNARSAGDKEEMDRLERQLGKLGAKPSRGNPRPQYSAPSRRRGGMRSERYDIRPDDDGNGKWRVVDTGNRNVPLPEVYNTRREALRAAIRRDRGGMRSERPLLPRPERGAAYEPLKQGLEGVTEGLLDALNPDRKKKKPLPERERPTIPMKKRGGMRSISPSKAVNASLDKTYQELIDEGHFKFPTKPHVAGKPIAVAHSAPGLAKLEEIVERGWMRGESPQRRVYFFPEGHESYLDWEGDYAYGFSDPFIDAGVTAQVTPKKPITIFHEDTHGSVDAQIAKQLGISESELKSTLMEQSELVPGTSEVADTARAAKPAWGAEHRSPLSLHRAFGVDLFADYTDNEDDGGNGHTLRGNLGSEIIVMDKDIIEVVGVRETGWTKDQIASHGGRRLYRDRNPLGKPDREVLDEDEFQAWRSRTNELASSGVRSTRHDRVKVERQQATPAANIREMLSDIDAYFAFLDEHHRMSFAETSVHQPHWPPGKVMTREESQRLADAYEALSPEDRKLVDEHDELWEQVISWSEFIRESEWERSDLEDELTEAQDSLNAAREALRPPNDFIETSDFLDAIERGESRDEFIERKYGPFETNQRDLKYGGSAEPEWREDAWGKSTFNEYTSFWDDLVNSDDEIPDFEREIEFLEAQIERYHENGTESARESFREALQAKLLERAQRPEATQPLEQLISRNPALNPDGPDGGMRSRRANLSNSDKQWLELLQSNPDYWSEVSPAVRAVASDTTRQAARDIRNPKFYGAGGGMRARYGSGGREAARKILAKIKPEHKGKEPGKRTLFYIGGTSGAGKSSVINSKTIGIPDDTEAAH